MKAAPEKSKLEAYLDDVAEATGFELCLFDFKYFTKDGPELDVPNRRRVHACQYCMAVKSNEAAWKRCIDTEHWRAERAASVSEPFLHTCFAGVTDLIVPLKIGPRLVGALYLGQADVQDSARVDETIRELGRKYGLSAQKLRSTHEQMPQVSESALRRLGPILRCARRFVEQAIELSEYRHSDTDGTREIGNIGDVPIYFLDTLHPSSEAIQSALKIIRRGYWKEMSQPMVAQKVSLSNSQFSRVFHEETGMTFRECLMQVRLEAAGYLLKRSNLKVYQIAEMVGYQNNSSMQRAFRRLKGFTPLTFVRRQGEQEFCIKDK